LWNRKQKLWTIHVVPCCRRSFNDYALGHHLINHDQNSVSTPHPPLQYLFMSNFR
jgi:hypothetical protein